MYITTGLMPLKINLETTRVCERFETTIYVFLLQIDNNVKI